MSGGNMSNKNGYFILLGVVVLGILLILWANQRAERRLVWYESYEEGDRQPYGLYLLFQLLKDEFPDQQFHPINNSLVESLPLKNNGPRSNLLLIGDYLYLDRGGDFDHLMEYVASGNNAFIATKNLPYDVMSELRFFECGYMESYPIYTDSSINLNFLHPNLRTEKGYNVSFHYKFEPVQYEFTYIDTNEFCIDYLPFVCLGEFDEGYINFIRVDYGEGAFFLHSNPLAFTNYYLRHRDNLEYTEKVFGHLLEGDIYYDFYHKYFHRERSQETPREKPGMARQGPLQFILSEPALRWAWYLLLAGTLLYFLFRSKREQRVIPVLEGNPNTSLEYIQTIGRLYFLQNDHQKLAVHKMKLFLAFVRDRYRLSTNEMDEALIKKIALKSQLPYDDIKTIFNHFAVVEKRDQIDDFLLVNLHHALQKFYDNCK
ncbi:MAG: hypothetical protein ACFB10_16505 [Salibacteraceae bacterium]